MPVGVRSKLQASAPLLVALAAALAVGAPLLVGQGVDVPDDALYYELASWEWLHYAWSNDLSPWFVPGKLWR